MGASSFAQKLAVTGALPRMRGQSPVPLRLGFLAPLSGPTRSWGQPGLDGCRLWLDQVNGTGGMRLRGRRHAVEILARDTFEGDRAILDAVETFLEAKVSLVLTLGGDPLDLAADRLAAAGVLTSTLLPSDLSPDLPLLIAPSEVHPVFNVTGVNWLARTRPGLRRIALCSQTDRLGLPSLATYRAACEVEGLSIVKDIPYPPESRAADEIVAAMMAEDPDILCWCTSAQPMVHALTEAAHARGFRGQILSCTADGYDRMIARTSAVFMEGFTFQFPDFDDPALAEIPFFFHRPGAFYTAFTDRFPGRWSAVSWEYAMVLDLWRAAVEQADSTDPASVLAAMKAGRQVHAFGPATWWGSELFGIDNALISDWPVVTIRQGKARIAEFVPLLDWLTRHTDVLARHMGALGQLWHQRGISPLAAGPSDPRSG